MMSGTEGSDDAAGMAVAEEEMDVGVLEATHSTTLPGEVKERALETAMQLLSVETMLKDDQELISKAMERVVESFCEMMDERLQKHTLVDELMGAVCTFDAVRDDAC